MILNPFDSRWAKWDLFSELKNPYDIDQMARAFIPDRGNADPTWTGYGRTFFSALVKQARDLNGVTDLWRRSLRRRSQRDRTTWD